MKEYTLWEELHFKPLTAESLATHQHLTSVTGMVREAGEGRYGNRIEEMRVGHEQLLRPLLFFTLPTKERSA